MMQIKVDKVDILGSEIDRFSLNFIVHNKESTALDFRWNNRTYRIDFQFFTQTFHNKIHWFHSNRQSEVKGQGNPVCGNI
jgi:hypothetical protein